MLFQDRFITQCAAKQLDPASALARGPNPSQEPRSAKRSPWQSFEKTPTPESLGSCNAILLTSSRLPAFGQGG